MIILPIGHEQGNVRRLPWVTFGIMGLCVLALALTSASVGSTEERAEEALRDLYEFYVANPHVDITDADDLLFDGFTDEAGEALSEAFKGNHDYFEDDQEKAAVQAEFNRRLEAIRNAVTGSPYHRWGLVPANFSIVGLITHMFMHAGWLHLLGNLLILYLGGPFLEDVWGRGFYLGFYIAAGVFASLMFVAMYPSLDVPLVGASGAIAGVMGAFLVRYWNTPIHFFYLAFFFHGTFTAPAWLMLPLWFVEQAFMASLTHGMGGGGVAYWAHIGGFAFGAGFAFLMSKMKVEERYISERLEAATGAQLVDNTAVDQALDRAAQGDVRQGFDLLLAESRKKRGNTDVALAAWRLAGANAWQAEAAPALLDMIREEMRRGDREVALDHWLELVEQVPNIEVDPALLLKIARELAGNGRKEDALAALRLAVLDPKERMTTPTLAGIARCARNLDEKLARGSARMALATDDLSDTLRAEMTGIVEAQPEMIELEGIPLS